MHEENTSERLVHGYVLAGGGSTRFGRDKALVEMDATPMLLRMRTLLLEITKEVNVIAPPEKYAALGITGIGDRWAGQGPLAGIITALLTTQEASSEAQWNLIVGCDMPFLTREWLAYLVVRAQASSAEVVAPQSAQGLEPLCACWRTTAAGKLQTSFDEGVRKITHAMKRLQMEVLDEADWKRFDARGRLFWNMNTAADYDEAKRIMEAQRA
ncbi:MAG: molybdenum cofactor guanylyltransferase [Candidatus Acidoferrum typicum]|nr:molybdenum cofactor guanylyltransferase [Candidatus Acidoferrum typicum]